VLSCAAHAGHEDTSTPPADTTASDADTRHKRDLQYDRCHGGCRRGVTGGPPMGVEFGVKKKNHAVEGPDGLDYTARLPLSSATLNYLADLMRGHVKKIGSRWRALPAPTWVTALVRALLVLTNREVSR